MGIRPSQEKQVKKRSIKVKWSFANMLFCFLVFGFYNFCNHFIPDVNYVFLGR